ncbi:glutaminase [Thermosynechococcaceae cyanobacterium Okahandja]
MVAGLQQLSADQVYDWIRQVQLGGQPLSRLPQKDAEAFAFALLTHGHTLTLGSGALTFPLMSVIKPFLLLYALSHWDQQVWEWVGQRPSEYPYNSVLQLALDQGWPRNPMINSGAIALAGRLAAVGGVAAFQEWLNGCAGTALTVDTTVLAAVYRHPNWHNRSLAHYLADSGRVADAMAALDSYNQICCLQGTIQDVARLGLLLACPHPQICDRHRHVVNTLMLMCGLYEDSPRYALDIGLPMKSGVSGLILAVVPQQGAIACYSPPLDASGNSVLGLHLLQRISHHLRLSPLS